MNWRDSLDYLSQDLSNKEIAAAVHTTARSVRRWKAETCVPQPIHRTLLILVAEERRRARSETDDETGSGGAPASACLPVPAAAMNPAGSRRPARVRGRGAAGPRRGPVATEVAHFFEGINRRHRRP